ncbi:MAG: hypothetical protein ACRDMV_25155 [Streptosporangiales bacterium]
MCGAATLGLSAAAQATGSPIVEPSLHLLLTTTALAAGIVITSRPSTRQAVRDTADRSLTAGMWIGEQMSPRETPTSRDGGTTPFPTVSREPVAVVIPIDEYRRR